MKMRKLATFLAVLCGVCLWAGSASARIKGPLEGEPIVRKKLKLRQFRVQLTPYAAMSLSQPYVHMGYVGGKVTFHFLDWIAVRAGFAYGVVPLESRLLRAINSGGLPVGVDPEDTDSSGVLCDPSGPPCRDTADALNPGALLHDFRSGLVRAQWQSSVDVVFTPFAGKLGLFSAIFTEYDIYIFGGLGLVNYARQYPNDQSTSEQLGFEPNTECVLNGARVDECLLHPVLADTGVKVGGSFGAGLNLMLTDWVALNLEVQDIVVGVNLAGLNATVGDIPPVVNNQDRDAFHNVTLQLGARFYLPPKAKRTR